MVPGRLVVEVHHYSPWKFCGLARDESWGRMVYFLEQVTRQARKMGIVPFYWDNGATDFRIFNRENNSVAHKQALDAPMRGATK